MARRVLKKPRKKKQQATTSVNSGWIDRGTWGYQIHNAASRGKVWIGIDPSLLSTGMVVLDERGWTAYLHKPKTKGPLRLEQHFTWLVQRLTTIKLTYDVQHVVMEGPSYGSTGQVVSIGELHGVLKLGLVRVFHINNPVAYPTIPVPSQVKKFAADHGRADKTDVRVGIREKWGVDIDQDDVADAYAMARTAQAITDRASSPVLTKPMIEVLDNLKTHDGVLP